MCFHTARRIEILKEPLLESIAFPWRTVFWMGTALSCLGLALFSKETGVTALGICVVYDILVVMGLFKWVAIALHCDPRG